MESWSQEIRYTLRSLARHPILVVVAVVSLALGIGINTAVFSVLDTLVLEPLPLRDPARSVAVSHRAPGKADGVTSFPAFVRYRERTDVFSDVTAFGSERPLLHIDGDRREQVYAEVVTASFFSVMDIRVPLGRPFGARDEGLGDEPVVILSHDFWRRRFDANPAMVGRSIVLNARTFIVIGIAGPGFSGLAPGISADVWMPIARWAELVGQPERLTSDERWVTVIGHLRPGVTVQQAQAALALMDQQPNRPAGEETVVRPAGGLHWDDDIIEALSLTGIAFAVGALVLALACANVANLLLARAAEREREMAVRLALGSGRARLMRLWIWDGVVLCLAAGVAALLVARWSLDLFAAFELPTFIGQSAMPALSLRFELDGWIFAFTFGLSLLTGIAIGLLSAVQAWKPDLTSALNADRLAGGRRAPGANARSAFIALQMALSLVLLIPCGLFVRSWLNASTIDPGFTADDVLLLPISSDQQGVRVQKPRDFEQRLAERVRELPGVEAATVTDPVPMWYGGSFSMFTPEGVAELGPQRLGYSSVGQGYFATLKIPLVRGRDFTAAEVAEASPRVAIVNETLARRFWPGGDALGKRLRSGGNAVFEVVGIARDARYLTLAETSRPWMYRPLPPGTAGNPGLSLAVRTRGDTALLKRAIEQEVNALVPGWPVFQFRQLSEALDLQRLAPRVGATLLGILGAFGLILAAIGIYGVVAYAVTHRTREIGVRMALGARHRDVIELMIRQGMSVCLIGAAAGVATTLAVSSVLGGLFYGISASDPLTYAAVPGLLILVALLACYVPARRAARIEPTEALRQ
jgi:macrolide transport system ATP-binding/permease protein